MFLATTALSEFWNKNDEILFLGSWCLRQDRRSEWEGLKYQVLTSPWNDRERYYQATRSLDDCGERLLDHLTGYLNAVHGVPYSKRYWRIIVGPWFFHHLHITYDRYVHLAEAFARYPSLKTYVLHPQSFTVPKDQGEMMAWAGGDLYNLQVFSQILGGMGHRFPARPAPTGLSVAEQANRPKGGRLGAAKQVAAIAVRLAEETALHASGRRWGAALCQMYAARRSMWALAWRSRLRAIPLEPPDTWTFPLPGPIFDARRNELAGLPSSSEFERVFIQSLPYSFPTLYLEAYHRAQAEALGRYRRRPRVLVSAIGWYFHEPFKFWAAEAGERGCRLVTVQHGGGYGMFRYSAAEAHEKQVGDTCMVWGWAEQDAGSCRNLPSPKHAELLDHRMELPSQHGNGAILFVATAHPRYLYRLQSTPVGSQWEQYFDWELRFLSALPSTVLQSLVFRPYPYDFGHGGRARIEEQHKLLRWDDGGPFYPRLKQSRLVVIDNCGTSLLEALAADVPTVLFWDPERWEIRQAAEPYFESLRQAGVLWNSPEAAAAKVAAITDEPDIWWRSRSVQEARQRFVERFVFPRRDWLDYWDKALRQEVILSESAPLI